MPYSYPPPPPPKIPLRLLLQSQASRLSSPTSRRPPHGPPAPPPLLEIFPTVGSVGEERRRMASRILIILRAGATLSTRTNSRIPNLPNSFAQRRDKRNFSVKSSSSLDPPDVHRLAETARISLTPQEVEEFGPKIQQVVEWFGQLRAVDLANVEPAIRSDIDGDNLREDVPQTFENREAIIAGIPSYEEPYIKVPKVLNKE